LQKKIVALLIATSFMIPQIAFADLDTQFDNRAGKLTLSGTLPPNAKDTWVTIEVINPKNDKTVFLTQTTTDADFNYETKMAFSVDLDHQSGEPLYIVNINYMHDGEMISEEVYYTPDTMTQLWIDIAAAEDEEAMKTIFAEADLAMIAEELGLGASTMDADTLAGHVFEITDSKNPETVTECMNCVREAIVFGEIKAGGMKKANELIALENGYVDKVLGMDSEDAMYQLSLSSSAKIKPAFLNATAEYYLDCESFQKAYATELLIQSIKKSENNLQIINALDVCGKIALGSVFEDSEYAKLNANSKKEKFAKILNDEMKSKELPAAFAEAEKKYKKQEEAAGTKKPSSGGGGGGSYSGGGVSLPFGDTISAVQTQKPVFTDMFRDLDSVSWAKEAINTLAKENIVSGVSEHEFEPARPIKREEFVKLLTLACGVKTGGAKSEFDDVLETDWFYPYVSGAYEAGIIKGISDNFFGTGSYISREDIAVMVYRVLAEKEILTGSSPSVAFGDHDAISEYAKAPVGAVAGIGIISGVGDNKFSPSENATRAQAAKIIYELTKILKGDA